MWQQVIVYMYVNQNILDTALGIPVLCAQKIMRKGKRIRYIQVRNAGQNK